MCSDHVTMAVEPLTDPLGALDLAGTELAMARAAVDTATEIARMVAAAAVEKGVSDVEIAKRLGVARSTLREWLGKG